MQGLDARQEHLLQFLGYHNLSTFRHYEEITGGNNTINQSINQSINTFSLRAPFSCVRSYLLILFFFSIFNSSKKIEEETKESSESIAVFWLFRFDCGCNFVAFFNACGDVTSHHSNRQNRSHKCFKTILLDKSMCLLF